MSGWGVGSGWVAPSELYEGYFPELVAESGFIKFLQGARVPVGFFPNLRGVGLGFRQNVER